MRTLYSRTWIENVRKFQSLSKEERNKWCSYCGCGGGCNLCKDISNIDENDIVDESVILNLHENYILENHFEQN